MSLPDPEIRLKVPGSKSQTQRALILAALAAGESQLLDPLDCDDSAVLRKALRALGVTITEEPACWRVRGGELRPPEQPLWCGEAGTALRFLAPLSLLIRGELILDGSERLKQRPLADGLEALARLGVQVRHRDRSGTLPAALRLEGRPGTQTWISLEHSSQFASGLLMVAPRLSGGLLLGLAPDPAGPLAVSRPYLELTLRTMETFGVGVLNQRGRLKVLPQAYRPTALQVEGDWSSAAFLLAGGRLARRRVVVENLAADSAQGDRAVVELLAELDALRPHRLDLTDCPDLIAPLAAAAVRATHPVELVGVAHARLKESDRVAVLADGLRAAGVPVEQRPDGLRIEPGATLRPAELETRGDHRMAMAFGLLSLLEPGIHPDNRGCVSKSYPTFWHDLERLR